jgi:hypothetical protein
VMGTEIQNPSSELNYVVGSSCRFTLHTWTSHEVGEVRMHDWTILAMFAAGSLPHPEKWPDVQMVSRQTALGN